MRLLIVVIQGFLAIVALVGFGTRGQRSIETKRKLYALNSGSESKSTQLSPFGLFLTFAREADSGFAQWEPRCRFLADACGAGHLDAVVIADRSVWFNKIASEYIKTSFIDVNQLSPEGRPSTTSFPNGSIIARASWAIVKGAKIGPSNQLVQLPIYDPIQVSFKPSDPSASIVPSFPRRTVVMNALSCVDGPLPSGAIPLGCFFHVGIAAQNLQRFQTDRLNVDAGDTVVLLGFHLILKREDGWKWATFWWQGDASNSRFKHPCEVKPVLCSSVPTAWRHYLTDIVTLPQQLDARIRPVMNPYIEGGTPNNVKLNCAVCHTFAASPMAGNAPQNLNLGAMGPASKRQVRDARNNYMVGKYATDNIWSVAQYLSHRKFSETQ